MLNRSFTKEENPNYELWSSAQKITLPAKQICRFEGKNKLIEFMSTSFNIDKILVNIISYDPTKQKGQKKSDELNFYLDFADALRISEDILNNNFAMKVVAERKKKAADKNYFFQPIYRFEGGVSANTLKAKGQERKDGKPVFRRLSFGVSTNEKAACVITIERGPGKSTPTGGIVADYVSPSKSLTGPDDGYQSIAILPDDLKRLAVYMKAHIEAYISAQYVLTDVMQENNFLHAYVETLKTEFNQKIDTLQNELKERSDNDRTAIKILNKKLDDIKKLLIENKKTA